MTDRIDNTVVSWQKNENGAGAQVIGKCENKGVLFTATVLDGNERPTVELPWEVLLFGAARELPVQIRINDNSPSTRMRLNDGKFRNNVPLMLFRGEDWEFNPGINSSLLENDLLSETWRILAQFETSSGTLLLKIPIYDSNVQKMIKSCS